jgi:hypothetical protein
VRNSSLVEWFCAENVTGLKCITEAMARDGITKNLENGRQLSYIRNFATFKKDKGLNQAKFPNAPGDQVR